MAVGVHGTDTQATPSQMSTWYVWSPGFPLFGDGWLIYGPQSSLEEALCVGSGLLSISVSTECDPA